MSNFPRTMRVTAALTAIGASLFLLAPTTALAADSDKVAVDIPRNDSDFWTTYAKYVPKFATELHINLVTTNSQNDVQKLVAKPMSPRLGPAIFW